MRQLLLEAINEVESGGTPRGVDSASYRHVRALDHLIPKELDWNEALREQRLAQF